MTTGRQIINRKTGEITELPGPGEGLTSLTIQNIAETMALCETLVNAVLEEAVDFGEIPGVKGKFLFDPGAQKIIRAFNVHVEHKVIFHEESDEGIAWTIQAFLMDSKGQVVGSGLGGASTRETKYRWRWVTDPETYGYSREEIDDLKTRKGYGDTPFFRIQNPEYGESVNTILLMAAKRSECDAAKSLPGVGSALRKLFDDKLDKKPAERAERSQQKGEIDPDYNHFWGIVKGMGVSENSAHTALGVKSIKDWVAAGHTLDEGIILIGKKLADLARQATGKGKAPGTGAAPAKVAAQVTAADVATTDDLVRLAELYWGMDETEVFKRAGYETRQNFQDAAVETPWEIFCKIRG